MPDGERILSGTFFSRQSAQRRIDPRHLRRRVRQRSRRSRRPSAHRRADADSGSTRSRRPAADWSAYDSDVFGAEYRDNLFLCQFNLRKVSRHILRPAGSTYTSEDSDFVSSDFVDFHPTDVQVDADGSLLVIDTGGWYKLCCPTSQLWKPDVVGGIYRVRKIGAKSPDRSARKNDRLGESDAETTLVASRRQSASSAATSMPRVRSPQGFARAARVHCQVGSSPDALSAICEKETADPSISRG